MFRLSPVVAGEETGSPAVCLSQTLRPSALGHRGPIALGL